ncbi:hypothetical protein Tco_0097409 [Tanacetum coccineum]
MADKKANLLIFKLETRVLLKYIEIDENLRFVEEPIEIVERDVKKLKRRRILIRSKQIRMELSQGDEYTWEHEDSIPDDISASFS